MNIAIVDDRKEDREKLSSTLRRYADASGEKFHIQEFESAEALLDNYQPFLYAILFLDIYMDGMTGMEAAEIIRETDGDIILVFITTSEEHHALALHNHAFDYMEKPVDGAQVCRIMDDILKRKTEIEESLSFSVNRIEHHLAFRDIVAVSASSHNVEIYDKQGNVTYENNKISWDPGTLTEPIAAGSDIKYAELKYTIEITDDILGQEPDGNGEYPTNGDAVVTYYNHENKMTTVHFPVPTVNPVLYTVEKVVQNYKGEIIQLDKDFSINVKEKDNQTAYDKNYILNTGEGKAKKRVLTNLRNKATYVFEEVLSVSDGDMYDTSYASRRLAYKSIISPKTGDMSDVDLYFLTSIVSSLSLIAIWNFRKGREYK